MKVKSLSRVRPSATPWTAAHQALPPMGFSRQEYWSGVPLPSPDRHLGGFYILATVSSATMNIGVHASFRIMFSSRYTLGSGIAVLCVHTCSVTQTLCDLMDCSLPGSFVHGMVQARILEWVAIFPPGNLLKTGIRLTFSVAPALQANPLPLSHWGSPQ